MYATTGESRIAIAVLAILFGGFFAAAILGNMVACGCAPVTGLMMLVIPALFVLLGAGVLIELWLKRGSLSVRAQVHGRRANVAIFVLLFLATSLGIVATLLEARSDLTQPAQAVSGRVEHLHVDHGARGTELSLKLQGQPMWLHWHCTYACGTYAPLRSLGDAPWPMAETSRLGNKLVGLSIGGRTYLEAGRERARLVRGDRIALGVCAAIAALLALGGVRWLKYRPRLYSGLDPLSAARARDMVRRTLPDPPRGSQ